VADVKMPTPVRTAIVLGDNAAPIDVGYSTGMSQPLNSTIFAPIWRWTGSTAVLRHVFLGTDGRSGLDNGHEKPRLQSGLGGQNWN